MRELSIPSEGNTQTVSLFLLDGLANALDFLFHFWMGRILIPSDFAILQTLNSIALVYVTAGGVFQPVVSRFIAEARGKGQTHSVYAIFQSFLRAAFWLGLILSIFTLSLSSFISRILNLPTWTIQLFAVLVFLSTLRPIAAGVLQGQERFLSFGLARLALSFGRIITVYLLLQAGLGLKGAIISLPLGWLISVVCAFLFLDKKYWKRENLNNRDVLREGWKLSVYALFAYFAYMSLTSLDLVWVNRYLGGAEAGTYASLVLMRRIIALLPGVAVTVMFPRVARMLAEGKPPHRLLMQTAFIILIASGALTVLYFIFSTELMTIIFGNVYRASAPLLGWMGVGMIGMSLSSIWLNYYLAAKPRMFVLVLIAVVAFEGLLLSLMPISLTNAILAFSASGWMLSLSGLLLYLLQGRRLLSEGRNVV